MSQNQTDPTSSSPEDDLYYIKQESNSFLLKLAVLSMIWLAAAEIILRIGLSLSTPLFLYILIAYSFVLTAWIHRVLTKSNSARPAQFVNMVMGLLGGKMFLSLTVLLIYGVALATKLDAKIVLIAFVPIYFGNTGLEIYSLLTFMGKEKARKEQAEPA